MAPSEDHEATELDATLEQLRRKTRSWTDSGFSKLWAGKAFYFEKASQFRGIAAWVVEAAPKVAQELIELAAEMETEASKYEPGTAAVQADTDDARRVP
jgi:hypothetical protein